MSNKEYYMREADLCESLLGCFKKAGEERKVRFGSIQQEIGLIGKTRVDFLLGSEVSVEVKFEPDYPGMPASRKPVTNVVLKTLDSEVAKHAGLRGKEALFRLYEVELDFLKLLALKNKGIPRNYLFCLDEDGRLQRTLVKSFRTQTVKRFCVEWKSIRRGVDGKETRYFLWQA